MKHKIIKHRTAIWLKLETRAMLNLIRDNNLLKDSLWDFELIKELVELMAARGYKRSPLEVKERLKSLEDAYFLYRKNRDDVGMKTFTHYSILRELFSKKRVKNLGNDEPDCGIVSDGPEEDSNIWLAEEIQKMLSIIEENDLFPELANGFSLYALKVIFNEIFDAGFAKDIDQIETALMSLKMSYVKTEEALKDNKDTELCPYFDYLKKLWGEEVNPQNQVIDNNISIELIDENTNNELIIDENIDNVSINNHIKDELIDDNDNDELIDDNADNELINDNVNNELVDDDDNNKLIDINSKENHTKEQRSSETEVLYNCRTANDVKIEEKLEFSKDKDNNEETSVENRKKSTNYIQFDIKSQYDLLNKLRPRSWNEKETLALLSSIEKSGVFKEFITNLTRSTAKQLVQPLEDQGYKRSTVEVLNKLKDLRETYLRSVLNGSNKINDNQKVILEIDNMIVGTRVDVDEALKSFGACKSYRDSCKLDGDHNYVYNGAKGERWRDEMLMASVDDAGDHDDKLDNFDTNIAKSKTKREISNDSNVKNNSANCNSEKSKNNVNNNNKAVNNNKKHNLLLGSWMRLTPTTSASTSISKRKCDLDKNEETKSLLYSGQSSTDFMKIINSPMPSKLIKIVNSDPAIIVERISSSQPPGLILIPQTITATATTTTAAQNVVGNITCQQQNTTTATATTTTMTIPLDPKCKSQRAQFKPQVTPSMSTPSSLNEPSTKSMPVTSIPISVTSELPKSTLDVIFKHEEYMQREHHKWMEKQFEAQRRHDRYHREIMLNELRQIKHIFSKAFLNRSDRWNFEN